MPISKGAQASSKAASNHGCAKASPSLRAIGHLVHTRPQQEPQSLSTAGSNRLRSTERACKLSKGAAQDNGTVEQQRQWPSAAPTKTPLPIEAQQAPRATKPLLQPGATKDASNHQSATGPKSHHQRDGHPPTRVPTTHRHHSHPSSSRAVDITHRRILDISSN